jgi:hypothetical protein
LETEGVSFVNDLLIPVVAVVVIVAIALLILSTTRRRRSEELRRRFGPEYERTVGTARDRGEAEKELREREQRVDALEISPLQPAARDRFADRWREVQAMFVDDPGNAVDQADGLIGEVMRARGYPVGDFEQRAADISVNHPQVVDHYRTAHAIALRRRSGDGATEQLRQAFVHYRALFADLLETPDTNGTHDPAGGAADAGASAPEARLVERETAAADATTDARRDEVAQSTGMTPRVTPALPTSASAPPTPASAPPTPASAPAPAAPAQPAGTGTTTLDTEEPVDPARRAQ